MALTVQTITCRIEVIAQQFPFYITSVHGFNDRDPWLDLWRDISNANNIVGNMPWLLMRDFNIIRNTNERVGGLPVDTNEKRTLMLVLMIIIWLI